MTPSIQSRINEILNQFIVYGQKQQPFSCARCGAQTDDKDQGFCWCTDPDSSSTASSPTWIVNINYSRYAMAESKAAQVLLQLYKELASELIGEDEPEYSQGGHLVNCNGLRDQQRQRLAEQLGETK